jgi:hypothetical protein
MAAQHSRATPRAFTFEPTPAVAASRTHSRFVDCSVCRADNSEYLFYHVGVRFVRCRTCGLVYVNPIGDAGVNYFDAARLPKHADALDRANLARDFDAILAELANAYRIANGRPPKGVLLLGRYLDEYDELENAKALGLEVVRISDDEFASLAGGTNLGWIAQRLAGKTPDIVILDELLEATSAPGASLSPIVTSIPQHAWLVVHYADASSLEARTLRRYWPRFFEHKRAFFSSNNLATLMSRHGLALRSQFASPTHVTLSYAVGRAVPDAPKALRVAARAARGLGFPMPMGNRIAIFCRPDDEARAATREKLSIVLPVYNEARYVAQVIDTILDKQLEIDRELIIVESNSTDGTRDVVRAYEQRDGVRVIYEDAPRGKGHAVRTGLRAVTGSIVLIQDADFEYDVDDYDALLSPILQHRTHFVLGSRSLGLDDWKIRRFEGTPVRRFVLNAAQVAFSITFNALYQQRVTDMNTMFKVFRTHCLDGIDLECDRFDLDVELVCKIVKNGYDAFEVPVNYVSRGFAEGKKVSFIKDAVPCYVAMFRYR